VRDFYERLGNVFAWLGFVCLTMGVIPFAVYALELDISTESWRAEQFFQIRCDQLEGEGEVGGLPTAGAATFDQNKCHLGGAGVATFWWELDGSENYGWIYTDLETAKQSSNFLHVTSGLSQSLFSAANRILATLSDYAVGNSELTLILTLLWPVLLIVNYLFWGGFRILPWRNHAEKI